MALIQVKAVALLYQSLTANDNPLKEEKQGDAWSVAQLIEHAIYVRNKQFGVEPHSTEKERLLREYTRGMLFCMGSLKKDAELREGLLKGHVSIFRLTSFTAGDILASRIARREKEKEAREHASSKQQPHRGMFRCRRPDCRSWETDNYQLQTRSADEGMTTFVTCLVCGQRYKC